MSIYLIALDRPDEGAWERLKAEWPKSRRYILTERLAFVAPEDIMLTEDIGEAIGMNEEFEVSGIVTEIQYDTTNGWHRQAVWEWLRKHQ